MNESKTKKAHIFSMFMPVFAGVIFFVLALININGSIWFDESYSAYLVRGDYQQIWGLTALDVHPPLYYYALKIWSSMFGTDIVAMRMMSVLFGLIAIVFMYHVVKRWFGVKAASVSSIVVAVSPMFIRFGQEMRMYTMALAIVMAATYFLGLALDNIKNKGGKKYWIIYAVLVSMGMWTHYFTAFAWLTHLGLIVYYLGGVKKVWNNKAYVKTIVLTYAVAVALYLPWLPCFIGQAKMVQNGFWIPEMSMVTPVNYLSEALVYAEAEDVMSWVALFACALMVVFVFAYLKVKKSTNTITKKRLTFILTMAVLPVLIMAALSLPPFKSTFLNRYTLYSIISLWVLFGIVIALLKNKRLQIAMVALVSLVAWFGVWNVEKREPAGYIKDIMAEVFIDADEGEPIIANTFWIYYDAIFYSSEKYPVYLFAEGITYDWGSLEPIKEYHVNLVDKPSEFLKDYEKVWLIVDTPEKDEGIELPEVFKNYRIINEMALEHHTALELIRK